MTTALLSRRHAKDINCPSPEGKADMGNIQTVLIRGKGEMSPFLIFAFCRLTSSLR